MRRIVMTCVLALVAMALIVPSAMAQSTGAITGVVLDPQGNAVPNAKVTVRDNEQGTVYTVKTDSTGTFTVPSLAFGVYSVTIEADGFRKWETKDIRVVTQQVSSVRANMEVGSIEETVTVEGGQQLLNTTSAEITTNISRQQILNLPLATRNPTELISLQAGVASTTGTRTSVFSGLRGMSNNITQDGINVQDNFVRNDGLFVMSAPTVENTGEFSISSANIGAESGAGVGQVRIATPRGSNSFTGSLFYFHRNDALNANTFANNTIGTPKERLRQHRFGGSVGGPVYIPKIWDGRDQSFFFFRYEGFREKFSVTRNRTVLTQSARDGLFSYRDTATGATRTVTLVGPGSISSNPHGFNPFTRMFLDAIPRPNNTLIGDSFNTGGVQFNLNGADPDNRYTVRIDQKLFESQRYGTHWVEWVYNWNSFLLAPDTFNAIEATWNADVPGVTCIEEMCQGGLQSSDRNVMALAIHSTLSPTLFNEARFGYQRAPVAFDTTRPFARNFAVAWASISNPEQNFPQQGRLTPFYTFIDNMSKVWRNHSFRWGFSISSTSGISYNDFLITALVTMGAGNPGNGPGFDATAFPGGISATDLARARAIYSDLVGLRQQQNQVFNAFPDTGFIPNASNQLFIRERAYNFYFTDTWRVRSNVSLTLGLRYELVPAPDVVNRRALEPVNFQNDLFMGGNELFNPNATITYGQLKSGAAQSSFLIPAGASNGIPFWNLDKNNFAPSVGVAWSINNKTVLRTGFAMSYSRSGLTTISGTVATNSGLNTQIAVFSNPASPTLNPAVDQTLPTPAFSLPRSQLLNWQASNASGMFTYDRNLRSPYVMQWSLGIEREITPTLAVEMRYVGNGAVKMLRAQDYGQINILGNGLLEEFNRAASNLAICTANRVACTGSATGAVRFDNRGIAGQVDLPILTAMGFANFTGTTYTTTLTEGRAGQFGQLLSVDCGQVFFNSATVCPGLATFPVNFFRSNPLGILMDATGNNSQSRYDSLQVEVRKRTSRGIAFQGNYTFGKVLTDSSGAGQNLFDPALDLLQPRFDRVRADFDIRHSFNFNAIWELPVGRGRRYASSGIVGKVLEGWQVGGILRWRSGRVIRFASGRGTLNNNARSGQNPAVLLDRTAEDVCNDIGVYRTDNGVFWLPQEYFTRAATGTSTSGGSTSIFAHPAAGTLGDQALRQGCDGPRVFRNDFNIVKRTYITEKLNFEFRAEFFNMWNNVNFLPGQVQTWNATGFGAATNSQFAIDGVSAREIQFNFRLNW